MLPWVDSQFCTFIQPTSLFSFIIFIDGQDIRDCSVKHSDGQSGLPTQFISGGEKF